MNSSENFSISDYPLDYENENDEGVEKVIQFWIEGILTPFVGLLGVLGKTLSISKFIFSRTWSYYDKKDYLLKIL